jgi:capsular polysaccharide biosynthesis protein
MEQEIDLRPFLRSILARWWLVLLTAALATLIGILPALLTSPRAVGRAEILILSTVSQVNLDPRFTTRDATLLTSATFQRQALISLATSSALEQHVANELLAQGRINALPVPGELLEQIRVSNQGDLIVIIADNDNTVDAVTLAETWARAYERMVAEVYTNASLGNALIATQISEAEERYTTAQAAYESFIGRGELVQVEQQVKQMQELLDGARTAGTKLYNQYLLRAQELDLILSDAQALREQVTAGTSDTLADGVALLTLRARAAGGELLPVQLSFADAASVARSNSAALADLEVLISAVETQRDALIAAAEGLAGRITADDDAVRGLGDAERARYEAELAALLQRKEQLLGERASLVQSRDVAFASLELLRRKADEQQIAETTPQIAVRFVGATLQPAPSVLMRAAPGALLGLVLGVILGLVLALLADRANLRRGRPVSQVSSSEQSVPTRS